MATSFKLTDGTTEIELVYNASTQTAYKLQYGAAVNSGGVNPRWFESDDAPPVLTDLTDANRQAFLTLQVEGASRDTVLNNIATIKRWVDGADQQAARYWLENKTTPRIDLKVQLNGTTNATLHPVIYGEVDDSASHYLAAADLNDKALEVTIMLMLAPYGEAETDVTLRNDLPSSPSMIEDSNGDGLADGLTNVNTPTFSGDLTHWLIGGVCQKFTTDAATTHGWRTNAVTASTSSNAVAYAWVYTASATYDTLSIQLTDGSDNTIATKSHIPSAPTGYDKTVTDSAGGTWYRYSVTGSNTVAADFRLKVVRYSTNATIISVYLVDAIYLEINQTVVPAAWCSSSTVYNRYDPSNTSATTRQYINYVDVWGIPGDAPALATLLYDMTSITGSGTMKYTIIGKQQEPYILRPHFVEGEDATFTAIGSISGGNTSDATRHGGAHKRITGTASPGVASLVWSFSGDDAKRFLSNVWQCYSVIRSSSTAATFELIAPTGSPVDVNPSQPVTVSAANTWECHYMGEINGRGYSYNKAVDLSTGVVDLLTYVGFTTALPNTQTFDIDFLIFFPVGNENQTILLYSSQIYSPTYNTGDVLIIDGEYQCAFVDSGPWLFSERLGGLWDVEPGRQNRIVMSYFNSSSLAWNLSDNWKLSITYKARTKHLLGTL